MTAIFADESQVQIFGMLAPWIGLALAVFSLFASLRACRRKRLIDDLPTSKTHGVFIGLVDTVKGYRDHEASTLEAVAALRGQLSATPPGQAGDDFHSVLGQVNILKEAYPDLKADTNFVALHQELSDTEQRIALARSYFNSIATFYNTRLQVVPDRFIAALGAMKPRALMVADDFERAPVNVSFAPPDPPQPKMSSSTADG
jgi:hypothetical protein